MRNVLCLLLCLCLTASLYGCQQPPVETTVPSTAPTVPEALPTAPVPDMTAVSLTPVVEKKLVENGDLLCTITYQTPAIHMDDLANASLIYEDLLARIAKYKEESEDILAKANELYSPDSPWDPYSFSCIYTPARMDGSIISLSGKTSSYAGGVHPNHWLISVTYDAATGKVLSLLDILDSAAGLDHLNQYVLDTLSNLGEDYFLYSDYMQVVTSHFTPGNPSFGSWYFTNTGLALYFSTYEIAPYATGDIVIEVPYKDLEGVLNDAYLPTQEIAASGELLIAEKETAVSFLQTVTLTLGSGGRHVLLYTDGILSDFSVQEGTWSADGTIFFVNSTLFHANRMTVTDAIRLTAPVPRESPTIRISYTANGQQYSYFLGLSDTDSSVSLLTIPK